MNPLVPWSFSASNGPARLHEELVARGVARLRPADGALDLSSAWSFAESLLGARPAMVERQIIRAVEGGRSFSSGSMEAPWHTDSQRFFGVAPDLQVMRCVRPAAVGGESLYLDTWPLLDRIAREDPELYRALFDAVRRMPFVFGDVYGPTVSLRRERMVFTQPPRGLDGDAVGARVTAWLAKAESYGFRADTGEVTVIDNHRVLHARTGFEGREREFVRVLIWLHHPLARHPTHHAVAARAADVLRSRVGTASREVTDRLGLGAGVDPAVRRRAEVVIDMLRGVSPGILAAREGVPEGEIYAWRDAFVSGAEASLGAQVRDRDGAEREVEALWRRLRAT